MNMIIAKSNQLALEDFECERGPAAADPPSESRAPPVSAPQPKIVLFDRNDITTGWQGTVPIGAGFDNMGNTCYMNATLQALFHVPSFANWLMSCTCCSISCDLSGDDDDLCLICAMMETLYLAHIHSGGSIPPELMWSRLKSVFKDAEYGRQEDAHEFLRFLIEKLELTCLKSVPDGSTLDPRSKETNAIAQIFGGYTRTLLLCQNCENTSTTFQHFQEISLDIHEDVADLHGALELFFRPESMNGYKCQKCNSQRSSEKRLSIDSLPNVLCVQLKRFDPWGNKITKAIGCPRYLDLSEFMFDSSSEVAAEYQCVSIINHKGSSHRYGHYTANGHDSNNQFYIFNDESVTKTKKFQNSTVSKSSWAYVLMYERVQQRSETSSTSNEIPPSPAECPISTIPELTA